MSTSTAVKVTFWSQGGKDRQDAALTQAQKKPAELAFEAEGRFYAGCLQIPAAGSLVLNFTSPRPVRLWIGGAPVVDEGLNWRFYERESHGAAIMP